MPRELPPDMMALDEAARLAQREIFKRSMNARADAAEVLDFIALAIAAHVRVYGSRSRDAPPTQIRPEELQRGYFRGGAMRFATEDGTLVTGLAVRRLDITAMLKKLARA